MSEPLARGFESKGFSINLIGPRSIDLSGTTGQVHNTFKTEIHYLDVAGVRHIANMSDPQIPAALAPAVAGIVSLNDFKPHPMKLGIPYHPRALPQQDLPTSGAVQS